MPAERKDQHPASQAIVPCLDTHQLAQLEQSFRRWVDDTPRSDTRASRRRILLIFLLIRYTGAKLNEILQLDPFSDINIKRQSVCIHDLDAAASGEESCTRTISIAESLAREIKEILADPAMRASLTHLLAVDPAFVRRKFYERAEVCGFPKRLGGPEMIRRARVAELLRGKMPLPAVQKLLGHVRATLSSAHLNFSEEELQQITRLFFERESSRTTSARNAFFGKIVNIERGDIQARVSLVNVSGQELSALITSESLDRLGLRLGQLITAEVKAPWILLQCGPRPAASSADNQLQGTLIRINRGKVSSEYVIQMQDGTELCVLIATSKGDALALKKGDLVWALFSGFAVIVHTDD
jgi:molybdate transport system regulatory protein